MIRIVLVLCLFLFIWRKRRVKVRIENHTDSEVKIVRTSDYKILGFIKKDMHSYCRVFFIPKHMSVSAFCGDKCIDTEAFSKDRDGLRWILSYDKGEYK